jgi:hypothetical protein
VGRIAGIYNPEHNEHYQDKVGFFGFFDAINDEEVVTRLFKSAEEKLVPLGMKSIRGPYNPTVNEECGLLVD